MAVNFDMTPYRFCPEDAGEMISDPAILEAILGFELPKEDLIPAWYTITTVKGGDPTEYTDGR